MKESGLEKLIELFRDYVENYGNDTKDPTIDNVVIYDGQWFYFGARFYSDEKVLSKKFGFIQWLVENDKIDRGKFGNSETKSSKYSDFELSYDTPREDYTNILLMELAIQDEPIQFLIEMLR